MAHAFNPSAWEEDAGLCEFEFEASQPGLWRKFHQDSQSYRDPVSKKTQENKKQKTKPWILLPLPTLLMLFFLKTKQNKYIPSQNIHKLIAVK